jgi:site-specific DNA-methyltransferase (adenine-specific)
MIEDDAINQEANTTHCVIRGDARCMGFIPDESVHLVLTSPPKTVLKGIDERDQGIHLISDYETFLSGLKKIWQEVFRVLVPGGRLVCIVGDVWLSRKRHGRHRVIPLHADICVLCRAIGFDNLNPVIWHKIPEIKGSERRGGKFFGSPYEPNGAIRNDVEFVVMQRKPGGYRKPTDLQRKRSKIDKNDYRKWFRQFWLVPEASGQRYPSPFPFEIAHRLINMFSFWRDTVLDPFCATGTTLAAAMRSQRNSIGIEMDTDLCHVAFNRLREEDEPLFVKTRIEFCEASGIEGLLNIE